MHFYGQSYQQVMSLPIKTFWLMERCIDRINAKDDLRSMGLQVAVQSGDVSEHHQRLVIELGTVVSGRPAISVERDQEGFNELKALAELL